MNAVEKLKAISTVTAFFGNEPGLQKIIDQYEAIGARYFVMIADEVKLGKHAIIFEI